MNDDINERRWIRDFARRRDETSFRRLYRLHTPALFAMAMRLSGSQTDAEEIVQDTWCRAAENFSTFRKDSALRTWLTSIVINCWRESIRKQSRMRPTSNDELESMSDALVTSLPVTPQTPADPIDIERALSRLPEGYREVVLLHDLNGYTHREIAGLLGIREGTSKSQLTRGRQQLRALLSPAESESITKRGTS